MNQSCSSYSLYMRQNTISYSPNSAVENSLWPDAQRFWRFSYQNLIGAYKFSIFTGLHKL